MGTDVLSPHGPLMGRCFHTVLYIWYGQEGRANTSLSWRLISQTVDRSRCRPQLACMKVGNSLLVTRRDQTCRGDIRFRRVLYYTAPITPMAVARLYHNEVVSGSNLQSDAM